MNHQNSENRKVLVLTCYVGETEIYENIKSVSNQLDVNISQHIVYFKSKFDAHIEIFECMKSNLSSYDYFLKLDADMILETRTVVVTMCKIMEQLSISRLSLPVVDFVTNADINGVHLLRAKNLILTYPDDKLRTDNWISKINGTSIATSKLAKISHGKFSSDLQLVRFVAQRILKALSDGDSSGHWYTIYLIIKNIRCNKNCEMSKVISSVLYIFYKTQYISMNGNNPDILDIKSVSFNLLVQQVREMSEEKAFEYIDLIQFYWSQYHSLKIFKIIIKSYLSALVGDYLSRRRFKKFIA